MNNWGITYLFLYIKTCEFESLFHLKKPSFVLNCDRRSPSCVKTNMTTGHYNRFTLSPEQKKDKPKIFILIFTALVITSILLYFYLNKR